MTLRPTYRQALARGICRGAAVGGAGASVIVVAVLAGHGAQLAVSGWLSCMIVFISGCGAGALLGLFLGRDEKALADTRGIRSSPWPVVGFAPWWQIADVRVELRGGRRQVMLYLDNGEVSQLPAPYDGRLLAADPRFEDKLFVLRALWANHRHSRAAAR